MFYALKAFNLILNVVFLFKISMFPGTDTELPFLHGTLVVHVQEAKDLPDTDR